MTHALGIRSGSNVDDRRRVLLIDGLLALTVAASAIPGLVVYGSDAILLPGGDVALDPWWTLAYTLVLCLPLTVRRFWPRRSHFGIVLLALLPAWIETIQLADTFPSVLISLFSVVSLASNWRTTASATAGAILAIIGPNLYVQVTQFADFLTFGDVISGLTYALTLALLVVAGASALRGERRRGEQLQEETIRVALAADARAEAAAATERRRLASELHDIVAHHVNLMVVQAESGPYVPDPTAARTTFSTIAESGRAALGELDRLLGVLRRDDGGVPGSASMAPLPTLDEIPTLVDSTNRAGVALVLERFQVPTLMEPALSATAHRIVQECITNVIKHGDHGEPARLSIDHTDSALRIRLDNRTASTAPTTTDREGYGLLSIRSRLEVFGGSLAIDDRDGRFRVDVTLPIDPSRASAPNAASLQ